MSDIEDISSKLQDDAAAGMAEVLTFDIDADDVVVRNAAKREVDVRLAPFDTAIETIHGPEVIEPGAFRGMAPDSLLLMGLEHEVHLGVGQDGKVKPVRRPMGRSYAIEERKEAGYASFRVAKTPSGDEFLALADNDVKVIRGVSIEMGKNARTRTETRNGRRTTVVEYADVRAVSPTYQPAYVDAQVLAVRSQEEEVAPVATETNAPDDGATEEPKEEVRVTDLSATRTAYDASLLSQLAESFKQPLDKVMDRLEKIEERSRMSFDIPAAPRETPEVSRGHWMEVVLRGLSGERIPDQEMRVVAEVVTTDNLGVVPDAFSRDLIGIIDPARPFMSTTRRLDTPESGMQLVVPKITQRPLVDKQVAEKDDLASQKTIITTESFDVETFGGVGDISLQLLKRADRSFLSLYLELLAEAYAIETEDNAVGDLITAVNDGGPEPATALNPANLNLGNSFIAAFNATRRPPDTIWLSTKAVGEFIDAKATTTNQPLYPTIQASASAGGGITGSLSGLRVVHVPALDDKGAYAIVGPSRGFAWAEDGTYTLQVDVPAKAGRDVALVGMVWSAPYYPAAFSLFNVAS